VDVAGLKKMAVKEFTARNNITGYTLENGNTLFVLGEGRLVNLACADGHPAEIMDMSFAIQALSAEYLVKNKGSLSGTVEVPEEIDKKVADMVLKFWNVEIDTLTETQKEYLDGWKVD
jgi:adenosylhomocysteinase